MLMPALLNNICTISTCQEQWQQDGDLLIIGGDWNEEVLLPSWHALWNELGLVSPKEHIQLQDISTYSCGCKTIGYGLCVPSPT